MPVKAKPDSQQSQKPTKWVAAVLFIIILGGVAFLTTNIKNNRPVSTKYKTGAIFSKEKFNKAPKYEKIAYGAAQLPSSHSMKSLARDSVGNQGKQGSCVGWAGAFSAQTTLFRTLNFDVEYFSPSYLFNQIALAYCEGSYLSDAMDSLVVNGGMPFSLFPYDDAGCGLPPQEEDRALGRQFVVKAYQRIGSYGKMDIQGMKEHINANHPLVIGMLVGWSFMDMLEGQEVWRPTIDDENKVIRYSFNHSIKYFSLCKF